MVEIIERDGGTKIKTFKSNRDEIISNQIPKDGAMCRESAVYYVVGSPGSGKSMLMESIMRFTCLIIDDCASDLRNKHVQKLLLKMIQNHRHMRLTIFIVAQSYQSLHITLRNNCTCLLQFRTGNVKERKAINDEVLCDYSPNECDEILHYIFRDKYEFLLYNRRKRLVCKSFNLLDIKIDRLI